MNDDIKVIDDWLPVGLHSALEQLTTNNCFQWRYFPEVTFSVDQKNPDDGFTQILKQFEMESSNYRFLKPILFQLGQQIPIKEVIKARVNLLLRAYENDLEHTTPHVDDAIQHWTAIYYIEDSDGPTHIFDQRVTDIPLTSRTQDVVLNYVKETKFTIAKTVDPKKGRLVIFDGMRFHAGSKPRNHQTRRVLAINWR